MANAPGPGGGYAVLVFLLVKKEIEKVGGWGDKIANANFAEEAEAS